MSELLDRIHETLNTWGGHPALIDLSDPTRSRSYSALELVEHIRSLAEQLRRWGIRPRQFVGLFLENSADFTGVFLALLELGAVPVPLKLEYRRIELDEMFANSQARVLIAEAAHLEHLGGYVEKATVILRQKGKLSRVQVESGPAEEPEISSDIASLNYTYRGLGYPLGALVPAEQYLACSEALQDRLEGRPGEKMLVVLPMSHIFTLVGCLFVPLLFRMTSVILRGFHPRAVFDAIQRHNIEYLTAVPELLGLLARLHREESFLPKLQAFVSGGSHLDAETDAVIREAFGAEILHGYGLTEFAPACGNVRGRTVAGSSGPVCLHVQVRIAADSTEGAGEILIRSERMFRGYYRRPRETSSSRPGGWFKTGDLGSLRGGNLFFAGELKRTRKVNGAMVDLAEVHKAIVSLPGMEAAEVTWEEGQITARVETDFLDRERLVGLKRSLAGLLAGYKIPRKIVAV